MERLEDYVKVGDTGGDILIYFCNYEDYENETDAGAKDDCGDLAVNPHGKKTFCKIKPDELFQVRLYAGLQFECPLLSCFCRETATETIVTDSKMADLVS